MAVPLTDASSDFGQTTIVQALSLGKPVVATKSPGVVDYVDDGAEGFLVEAGDIAGLRTALLRLAADTQLRQRCSILALERARRFSYPPFADRVADLCMSLAGAGPDE